MSQYNHADVMSYFALVDASAASTIINRRFDHLLIVVRPNLGRSFLCRKHLPLDLPIHYPSYAAT